MAKSFPQHPENRPAGSRSHTSSKGENALVAWLTERFVADARRVPIGIGDDMAVVRLDGPLVAITADMLLDGVHFDTERQSYELIGRKAIACSLSDCAAMACTPRAATVSIALNRDMTLADVQRMYEGMARLADEHGCAIVGGDTTSWSGRLVIDVAILAEPMAARGPVRRSGAQVGDTLFVSGPLGGSLLGRHLTFEPRLDLAQRLAGETGLHAMMDLSDGLAMDLHRLCTASGCDAELRPELIERAISDAARQMAQQDGRPALEHALSDGEDFELLVVGDAELGSTPQTGVAPASRRCSDEVTRLAPGAGDVGPLGPVEEDTGEYALFGLPPRSPLTVSPVSHDRPWESTGKMSAPARGPGKDGSGLWPVGRIVSRSAAGQSSLWMVSDKGERTTIEPRGFEHWQ